jgi:succinate dehydrogenase/fumarate reductase flavoprotein subunit
MVKEYTTEVLVISSGGAGFRSAIEAEARSAKVLIVCARVGKVTKEEHYKRAS